MSEYILANKEDLTAIADAVRESTGGTDTYSVSELRTTAVNIIESGTGTPDAVRYNEQDLTDAQMAQARTNIGAEAVGAANEALEEAKSYTDTQVSEKADESALNAHIANPSNPHGVTLTQLGVNATADEINYLLDGVTSAIQDQLDAKVPATRTVNGKALSANIVLSAADVGAQPKLTGSAGQVVGFDAEGNAVAQEAPSGGGEATWAGLPGKPVVMQGGGDTLTWDGNTEGKEIFPNVGLFSIPLYCISEAVPPLELMQSGCSMVMSSGEAYEINGDTIRDHGTGGMLYDLLDGLVVVVTATIENGSEVLYKGTYFAKHESYGYTTSLTIPGYTGFGQEKIAPSHLYRPDWNQNDASAADYVKNRPFYEYTKEIIPEMEASGVDNDGMYSIAIDASLFSGNETTLIVTFDGVKYACEVDFSLGTAVFGNMVALGGQDTGEPFVIVPSMGICGVMDAESHTLKIEAAVQQKMDSKYVDLQATFYYGITEKTYLYTDQALSTKATFEQLYAACESKPISIKGIYEASGLVATYTSPLFYTFVSSYATAAIVINASSDGSLTVAKLYTAEYTAT